MGGGGGIGGIIGSIGGGTIGEGLLGPIGAIAGADLGGKVGGMIGGGGPDLGQSLGFKNGFGAGYANTINPSTMAQANTQYGNVQQGLGNQADFLKAVQAQNGLQNQTGVFNQLQNQANGTGFNPAQAMLNNATGANIANQAALMAGQRGSGANAGLMARQAAMQGGALQQQAAGQGALLQAQQSQNALSQMGSLATSQANQQANATNAYSNSAQGAQQSILNSIAGQNNTAIGMQSNVNGANAQVAEGNANRQASFIGNIMGGVGSALALAEGGQVRPMYSAGTGNVAPIISTELQQSQGASTGNGPKSSFAQSLQGMGEVSGDPKTAQKTLGDGSNQFGKGIGTMVKGAFSGSSGESSTSLMAGAGDSIPSSGAMDMMMAAEGGKVPALVSPGEVYLNKQAVKDVKKGENPIKAGEKIPGKPKYPGNDYRNDVVPKTLESGGLVIPNEVLQSKYPHKRAMEFVNAHLAKNGKLPRKG